LDGRNIAENQKLHSSVGRVGLQSSVSAAVFDRFEVDHPQGKTHTRWSGLGPEAANETRIESLGR
jgi:hypothetical protein